jgi:hypothetical protein
MTHSITLLVLVHQNIYNSITVAVSCASTKVGFGATKNFKRYSLILRQTDFFKLFSYLLRNIMFSSFAIVFLIVSVSKLPFLL